MNKYQESQLSFWLVCCELDLDLFDCCALFVHTHFLFFFALVQAVNHYHDHWVTIRLRRIPMGMTVAKMIMAVVERPPLLLPPPLPGTLRVTVDVMTFMLAMLPPC